MPINYCIRCTLPHHLCVCASAPQIILPKKCSLLFHPREIQKRNSSGRLLRMCSDVHATTWHRLKNQPLASQFGDYCLIYPHSAGADAPPINEEAYAGYLWIDSTWQQSQKMLSQSPWLRHLPRKTMQGPASGYKLRRNQKEGGLSTLESLAYWLEAEKRPAAAKELLQFFHIFQDAFLKARLAGLLK
ncbi:MAG: tRNA-uridine aminocarboxypropyltransferase [Bermanella sp.]